MHIQYEMCEAKPQFSILFLFSPRGYISNVMSIGTNI